MYTVHAGFVCIAVGRSGASLVQKPRGVMVDDRSFCSSTNFLELISRLPLAFGSFRIHLPIIL